jgi:TolB protein
MVVSSTSDLAAVSAVGGEPRPITAAGSFVLISRPRVSPDGRSVVFGGQRCFNCPSTLDVAAISGGPVRQLASGAIQPDWSPDGRELAYIHPTPNGESKGLLIYVIGRDGRNGRNVQVEQPGEKSEAVPIFHNPTYSPDGRVLAFDTETEPHEIERIALLDLASGRTRELTEGRRSSARPAFSPDGREVAYVCEGSSGADHICLVSADGGRPKVIVATAGEDGDPDFSPDGNAIVFDSDLAAPGRGVRSIYVVGRDGRGLRRLTSGIDATEPAFTPDGTAVVFTRRAIIRQQPRK